jgi:hypothetical protein
MIPFDVDLRLISTPLTRAEKIAVCPVADVKAQARVSHSDEDTLIGDYVEAAYDFLSGPHGWLGRCCILEEDWEWFAGPITKPYLEFPLRPIANDGVADFEMVGADGTTYSAVATTVYHSLMTATFPRIALVSGQTWPYAGVWNPRSYRFEFTAGFTPKGSPLSVPSPIRQCIKLLAAYWYNHRESSQTEPSQEIMYGLKAVAGRYRIGPDHS